MKSTRNAANDIPVMQFKRQKDWAAWLDKNHTASSGVWLKLAKKASGLKSVSYDEALEAALCYGWIDGQKKSYDESAWLQKFTPRGAKSIWSKINREKAQELIRNGRMKPPGWRRLTAPSKMDVGTPRMIRPVALPCRTISRWNWTGIQRQKPFLTLSTAQTGTLFFGEFKPPRKSRPAQGVYSSSYTC